MARLKPRRPRRFLPPSFWSSVSCSRAEASGRRGIGPSPASARGGRPGMQPRAGRRPPRALSNRLAPFRRDGAPAILAGARVRSSSCCWIPHHHLPTFRRNRSDAPAPTPGFDARQGQRCSAAAPIAWIVAPSYGLGPLSRRYLRRPSTSPPNRTRRASSAPARPARQAVSGPDRGFARPALDKAEPAPIGIRWPAR